MVRDMGNLALLIVILAILGLLLLYQVTQFCDDRIVEEMDGVVKDYKRQILKDPEMVVELSNGQEVEVRGVDICPVGAKIHVVHVEGNCNNGWQMPDECPD